MYKAQAEAQQAGGDPTQGAAPNDGAGPEGDNVEDVDVEEVK